MSYQQIKRYKRLTIHDLKHADELLNGITFCSCIKNKNRRTYIIFYFYQVYV